MIELFRFFRLGIINVIGVTLPGLLTLFLFSSGFLLPCTTLVFDLNHRFAAVELFTIQAALADAFNSNKGLIAAILVILAYVIGYIIRLSTPDELDRVSAKNVLENMGAELAPEKKEALKKLSAKSGETAHPHAERVQEETEPELSREAIIAAKLDSWPYQGEVTNKFPYYHFKQYLQARGLTELSELVRWGRPASENEANTFKRSKTAVNLMKLEVGLRSAELASVIESNEAHVRLLFGTWQAITICHWFVVAGLLVSLFGLSMRFTPPAYVSPLYPSFLLSALLGIVLLLGMVWARRRIEHLFHYQRVRELTHIVGCVHFVNKYRLPLPEQPPEIKS